MYNSSRGILYTAPPAPDETDENRVDAGTDAPTEADSAVTSTATETAESLAADD